MLFAMMVWFVASATMVPLRTKFAPMNLSAPIRVALKVKVTLNESVLPVLLSGFSSTTEINSGDGTGLAVGVGSGLGD